MATTAREVIDVNSTSNASCSLIGIRILKVGAGMNGEAALVRGARRAAGCIQMLQQRRLFSVEDEQAQRQIPAGSAKTGGCFGYSEHRSPH